MMLEPVSRLLNSTVHHPSTPAQQCSPSVVGAMQQPTLTPALLHQEPQQSSPPPVTYLTLQEVCFVQSFL